MGLITIQCIVDYICDNVCVSVVNISYLLSYAATRYGRISMVRNPRYIVGVHILGVWNLVQVIFGVSVFEFRDICLSYFSPELQVVYKILRMPMIIFSIYCIRCV